MIIGIDARPALSGMTGVGTYIYQLSRGLISRFPSHLFKIFSASYKDRFLHPFPDNGNLAVIDRKIPVKAIETVFKYFHFPPIQSLMGRFDLFHSPSPVLPPMKQAVKVITVHDLYFLIKPEHTQRKSRELFKRLMAKHLDVADGVICVSNSTSNDLLNMFRIDEDKVRVIHHGIDHVTAFLQENKASIRENARSRFGLRDDSMVLLYVGTIEPRKNPLLLLNVFEELASKIKDRDLRLVFGGSPGWGSEPFLKRLRTAEYRDKVVITGYLPREELDALYLASDIVVVPSEYEGFGFPLLEAMRIGKPVVSAYNSSLPEVGGDAALYFKTGSVDNLESKLTELITNATKRKQLIKAGYGRAADFTWQKTAERTMNLYESLI